MRVTNRLLTLAAIATTAAAQAAYGAPSNSSSVHVMPMNCTAGCETVTEPCTESAMPTPTSYGTPIWTPAPPPGTGEPPAPTTPATWSMGQPSATPEPQPEQPTYQPPAVSPPARYEGGAARFEVVGGLVVAVMGALPLLI